MKGFGVSEYILWKVSGFEPWNHHNILYCIYFCFILVVEHGCLPPPPYIKMQNSNRISLCKCLQPKAGYVSVLSVFLLCALLSVSAVSLLRAKHLQEIRTAGGYYVYVCTVVYAVGLFLCQYVCSVHVCLISWLCQRDVFKRPLVEQSWQDVFFMHLEFLKSVVFIIIREMAFKLSLTLLAFSHIHITRSLPM